MAHREHRNPPATKRGFGKDEAPFKVVIYSVWIYVISLLWIFPLYFQDKYYNMGEAKFLFFKQISIIFLSISFLGLIYHVFITKDSIPWKKLRSHLSITDYFVIAYAAFVLISYLLTPYKTDALWGYEGWYMGLISQLIFIILYFLVSRFLDWKAFLLHGSSIASAIVFLIAILHRFQIDPLAMYENLSMTNKILFLSTIGQATWYSSYLCTILPIGIYLFWKENRKKVKLAYGVYLSLGFASLVTQNSDSAFVALGLMLLVLLVFSLRDTMKMKHFLEVVIVMLSSFKAIGIAQFLFAENMVPLEELSIKMSQGNLTWILLGVTISAYLVTRLPDHKKRFRIVGNPVIPRVVVGLAIAVVPVTFVLLLLTTNGMLPSFLSGFNSIGYLHFNNDWGNGRGFTWQYAAAMFAEYSPIRKLFGCGPDCFAAYSYELHSAELTAKWGDSILTNAHNEWFTSLLFFGIAGVSAYIGIFISQVISCVKYAVKEPFLIAVTMSVLAYMGHNFFCYQQVVCTPIIFIIMAMGENRIKKIRESR